MSYTNQQWLVVRVICSITLFVISLSGCTMPTSTPAVTSTPELPAFAPVDAFEQNQQLGRGVNFGNSLEAPSEGEWGLTLEESFFEKVKEAGFNTIRLPVRWSAHAETAAPYTIDPTFFERIDWAIQQATTRGLNIVVNVHHYDELITDPAAHRERFIALWSQIADRYQDYPASLLFELCNEPNGTLTAKLWNQLASDTLVEVRKTNPTRNIVIGPGDWNSFRALPELELPADDQHIIVTFHYYEPMDFTHQGAEWVDGADAWLGTTWEGTSNQKSQLNFQISQAKSWGEQNKRPIFMGEFGAYSKADLDSRVRWTAFVARTAEKYQMSWAYWEFASGFGIYDSAQKTWNEPLLDALMDR